MSADLIRMLDAIRREQPRGLPVRDLRDVQQQKLARADAVVAAGRAVLAGRL